MPLAYALITPARDEAENLRRLAECLAAQTVAPAIWVVVDNGSEQETHQVLDQLAADLPWFRWVASPPTERPLPGGPIVKAFHRGLDELPAGVDVVVKLDADISFDPDHFERLLTAFEDDPRLGIAGSTCLELEDGAWQPIHVTGDHVRGAVRAYRRPCLDAVLPLPECVGWDGVDELKAQVLGWRTGLVPGVSFRHHRKLGARDAGKHGRWFAQGRGAHFMGYRPLYLLLRVAHHARRDRGAVGMLWGYASAVVRREPVYDDRLVREHLRSQQSLRSLHIRAREALGRSRVR